MRPVGAAKGGGPVVTRRRSPVLGVLSGALTVLLLAVILAPFFRVLQGALFPQAGGFSLLPVY